MIDLNQSAQVHDLQSNRLAVVSCHLLEMKIGDEPDKLGLMIWPTPDRYAGAFPPLEESSRLEKQADNPADRLLRLEVLIQQTLLPLEHLDLPFSLFKASLAFRLLTGRRLIDRVLLWGEEPAVIRRGKDLIDTHFKLLFISEHLSLTTCLTENPACLFQGRLP